MIQININQKKNNLFLNIINESKKQIYINSIGLEKFESKSISFPLIEFLIAKMLSFFIKYISLNYFVYNKEIYLFSKNKFLKKKIFIFFSLNIINNFNYFINSFLVNLNLLNVKFDNFSFLSKIPHGGCKLQKSENSN